MDLSTIPTEIGLLTNLSGFVIKPTTKELGGATLPTELGNCEKLESISGYRFTGSIPTELGRLTNLVQLELKDGELTSALPSEIGQLTGLFTLSVLGNQLEGTLPSELGKLKNLDKLEIHYNNFTGSIPSGICISPVVSIYLDCGIDCGCCNTGRGLCY